MMREDGFAALYRARYAHMVRMATLLVDRRDVAEEVVQEAFVQLYQRWASVDCPDAYLRTCVVHGCRDLLRRRRLLRRHRGETPGVVEPVEHLRDAIAGLPPGPDLPQRDGLDLAHLRKSSIGSRHE